MAHESAFLTEIDFNILAVFRNAMETLKRPWSGVYMITNRITNQFYIGSSVNVNARWIAHVYRYKDVNGLDYNKKLYQNMRKYGIQNFLFQILEFISNEKKLRERENYYIKILEADDPIGLGLNLDHAGENHGKAKVTENDVFKIRQMYANGYEKHKVFEMYKHKINYSGFHKIWNGSVWTKINMGVYTEENRELHRHMCWNNGSKVTEDDVEMIRLDKKYGTSKTDCYSKMSDHVSYWKFNELWKNA